MKSRRLYGELTCFIFFSACLYSLNILSDIRDYDLKKQAKKEWGLTGNPAQGIVIPNIKQSVLAQLGKELFFSKSLSVDFEVACASCHHPFLAGADGLSLPVGVGALDPNVIGPGRRHNGNFHIDTEADGGPNVARNSPTTFNSSLYQHALFDDGRVEKVIWMDGQYISSHEARAEPLLASRHPEVKKTNKKESFKTPESLFMGPDVLAGSHLLQAQARFPVTAAAEMRGFSSNIGSNNSVRAYLAKRLRGETGELKNTKWPELFRKAFNEPNKPLDQVITFDRITIALAEYQSSQVFINNPWRAYLEGLSDITEEAKQGALLFYSDVSKGGAGCVSCHSGDFFTNEHYFNLAVPQFGRGNFVYGQDLGRYPVTRRNKDMYAFRVPSLLNVTETGPYGHTGAFNDLQGIIEHHLNPDKSIKLFDFTLQHLPQFEGLGVTYPDALTNTQEALQHMKFTGMGVQPTLSKMQIRSLIEFLKTLTDPCLKNRECLAPWLPDRQPADENRLIAKIPMKHNNRDPLPKIQAPQQKNINTLPHLGKAPYFSPLCKLSNHEIIQGNSFTLVTENSGLTSDRQFNFSHLKTSLKEEGLVAMEHLLFSGGVAAGDIDGDCYTDLIISHDHAMSAQVYINNGNGTFTKKVNNLGLDKHEDLSGAMLVDMNGDGWLDLFYGNILGTQPGVYLNNGQSFFQRVTNPGFRVGHVTLGASFGDVDGDGDLDAFLAHWARPSKTEEEHLWLNTGNGIFVPGARAFGLTGHFGERDFTFTPNFADINGDQKVDLLSVSDFFTTQVFLNNQHSSYVNITDKKVITDQNGMGSAIADFDNDGDLDWFVTSIFYPRDKQKKMLPDYFPFNANGHRLYRNDASTPNSVIFSDMTEYAGVRNGGWGWGACAADFDNDGWVDIFHTNGVPYKASEIRKDIHYLFPLLGLKDFQDIQHYQSYKEFRAAHKDRLNVSQMNDLESLYYVGKQLLHMNGWVDDIDPSAKLFMNNKKGKFIELSEKKGIADTGQGRGISCLDYDRDGDIDILIINNQGKPSLYRNDFGNINNFLTVKLIGKGKNIHAIGARVYIETESGKQMREVRVENNYLSQNPIESHFGLGQEKVIKKLTVLWPNGEKYQQASMKAGKIIVIKQ